MPLWNGAEMVLWEGSQKCPQSNDGDEIGLLAVKVKASACEFSGGIKTMLGRGPRGSKEVVENGGVRSKSWKPVEVAFCSGVRKLLKQGLPTGGQLSLPCLGKQCTTIKGAPHGRQPNCTWLQYYDCCAIELGRPSGHRIRTCCVEA